VEAPGFFKYDIMRFLLILVLFPFSILTVQAQQKTGNISASTGSAKQPLVFVDTFATSMKGLIMDPGSIRSINVYKDTAALNRYGKDARDGVILIHMKGQVSLLRLDGLYKNFNVADSLRHYPVCIDEVLIDDPRLILADLSQVNAIHSFTSVDWTDLNHPKSEKRINIITRKNGL
jgi:hypothetical protein